MAGRGVLHEDATQASRSQGGDARIFLWRDGRWASPAQHPLHVDKSSAGVGPGLAFARDVLEALPANERSIGLVPCAVGGTAIARWEPDGGDCYETAAAAAREAVGASSAPTARLSGVDEAASLPFKGLIPAEAALLP